MSMKKFTLHCFFISVQIYCSGIMAQPTSKLSLFDFRDANATTGWTEQSDTVRSAGRSKAAFDAYETQTDGRRAVLFTLLSPQPNGACFAGARTAARLNLDGYGHVSFACRTAGNATVYKIVLRHDGQNDEPHPTFEQTFRVNNNAETAVKMPISQFKPYYRGKIIDDGPVLNVKNITSFGIQVAGGVYENFKQSGVSSFVVDQIWAEP